MRAVKTIPEVAYEKRRDPWLDDLFDQAEELAAKGEKLELSMADVKKRWHGTNPMRSASSSLKQAADARKRTNIRVSVRGDLLYVEAIVSDNGQRPKARKRAAVPTKATATKKAGTARPRKAPARKAS